MFSAHFWIGKRSFFRFPAFRTADDHTVKQLMKRCRVHPRRLSTAALKCLGSRQEWWQNRWSRWSSTVVLATSVIYSWLFRPLKQLFTSAQTAITGVFHTWFEPSVHRLLKTTTMFPADKWWVRIEVWQNDWWCYGHKQKATWLFQLIQDLFTFYLKKFFMTDRMFKRHLSSFMFSMVKNKK